MLETFDENRRTAELWRHLWCWLLKDMHLCILTREMAWFTVEHLREKSGNEAIYVRNKTTLSCRQIYDDVLFPWMLSDAQWADTKKGERRYREVSNYETLPDFFGEQVVNSIWVFESWLEIFTGTRDWWLGDNPGWKPEKSFTKKLTKSRLGWFTKASFNASHFLRWLWGHAGWEWPPPQEGRRRSGDSGTETWGKRNRCNCCK